MHKVFPKEGKEDGLLLNLPFTLFLVDDIEMKTTLRQILEKFITSKYG